MLNKSLDIAALRHAFAKEGRIRVQNVFDPELADGAAADLSGLSSSIFSATGDGIAIIYPTDPARWERSAPVELQRRLQRAASRAEGFA
jgi:hypothetical protein